MITLVVSGGQTGADQAGWRAAKRFGISTGGWMPKGFKTEAGPRPEFASLYNAQEHWHSGYPLRTRANAVMADVTIWFGRGDTSGFECTMRCCENPHKPVLTVLGPDSRPPSDSIIWINGFNPSSINVAGNRESSSPGVGEWVESYLSEMFKLLGHKQFHRN